MPGVRGRSGAKAKPTALKIISGNPGRRPLPKNEPQPTPGSPTCPSWLTGEAKAEWKRIIPELEKLKMAAKIDRATVAAYCESWSLLRAATEDIAERGVTLIVIERELEDGTTLYATVTKNPAVTVANAAMSQIRGFCSEFGLSPAARARLAAPEAPDDAKERYLS